MQQFAARVDDELGNVLRGLAAEIEVSMALSRAMMCTLAALSPNGAATVGASLEDEAVRAHQARSQHVIDALDELQARLRDTGGDAAREHALERALVAAAEREPEGPPLFLDLRHEACPHLAKSL